MKSAMPSAISSCRLGIMGNSIHDLMNTVESVTFDAQMSIFSGFNSFLRALREDETIKQLQQILIASPNESNHILTRLIALLEEIDDLRYAHPKDVQIASYLYVLSLGKEFPLSVTEKVLQTPNLMWAKRFAEMMSANQSLPT